MRNLILPGSRSKTNEKGRVEDNYLVQVSTCWFLLLIRKPSPRSARAVPLLVSTLISTDRNRRRRSSRRHDQFSQNLCSNLPLNLSRSNLEFCGIRERKWWLKTLGSEKDKLKRNQNCIYIGTADYVHLVRHDAPYGASWRTVHFSVNFPIYINSSKLILKPYFLSNSLLD